MINTLKGICAAFVLTLMTAPAYADISGKVGVASDNYFRGLNISDGFGYSAKGMYSHDSGLWAGGSLMSIADDEFMYSGHVGYVFNVGDLAVNLAYSDRRIDDFDWQEIGIGVEFEHFGVRYQKGLDDAGDFYAVDSSILKFVELEYGDWDDGGSYFKVSKHWDLLGGQLHAGYIDHEDNEDDFADKIQDFDNFYVGYSYKF